jgi:predicted O-methyltransferase YrrM
VLGKLHRLNDIRWWADKCRSEGTLRGVAVEGSAFRSRIRGGGVRFLSEDVLFERILADLGRVPDRLFQDYLEELAAHDDLRRQWEWASAQYGARKYRDWQDRVRSRPGNVVLYYALFRELRPKVIVETGTATGSMTSYMLAALEANGAGRLISIDIPPQAGRLTMDVTVDRSDIGYWIPEALRHRWDYRIGDAKVLLPRVMAEEQVDVFVHDSLHTRTHMLFEYAVARCLMRDGTLIVSDDILWNNAFDDFLALNRLPGYAPLSNPNIGCFVNRFDAFERDVGTAVVAVEGEQAPGRGGNP